MQPPHWDYKYVLSWGFPGKCNLSCPYCNRVVTSDEIDIDAAITGLTKIQHKYGKVRLSIGGAEPTQRIPFLSKLADLHYLTIVTNMTFSIDEFTSIDPDSCTLTTSFHPYGIDLDVFIGKIKALKSLGYIVTISSIVAYPPIIDRIAGWRDKLSEYVSVQIHPYNGSYKGKNYPGSYTDEEWNIVGDNAKKKYYDARSTSNVKVCMAGYNYGRIEPDGRIVRCISGQGGQTIGNVYTGEISWHKKPRGCPYKVCHCPFLSNLRVLV